ncbi:ISAs1 family transposase [Streptosporangium lutulentum]
MIGKDNLRRPARLTNAARARGPPCRPAATATAHARGAVAVSGVRWQGTARCAAARRGQVRLLSLFDTTGGTVVAQRQIGAKSTEVPELAPLLTGLDLAGMVLTGDALHTVRESARHLTGDHRAHYVLLLKDNQPTLLAAAIRALSGTDTDFATRTHTMTDRGHGRTETRTIRTAPAVDVGFPGAAQLFRILRYRGGLDGVRISKEVVFGLTSLPADPGPKRSHVVRPSS